MGTRGTEGENAKRRKKKTTPKGKMEERNPPPRARRDDPADHVKKRRVRPKKSRFTEKHGRVRYVPLKGESFWREGKVERES